MVRSRVYGILAGYEDQNDHDTLRTDPVIKRIADRSPDDDDLASQPTLSRFENAISIKSLKRLRDVFLDQCGGGSRRSDAADRGPAVIELAPPGLVSLRVRALAPSPAKSRSSPLRLTCWTTCFAIALRGGKGRCAPAAGSGRRCTTNGLAAPGRQPCGEGLE
jgi:hypothetical protein